ncbi:hypothetical protein J3E68DRAFT_402477 [Trichoderma sp. SZMC 28012]
MASSVLVAVAVVVFNRDATGRGAEINLLCYFIFSMELHTRVQGNKSSRLGGLCRLASFVVWDGSPRHVGGRNSVADWGGFGCWMGLMHVGG